jgi:hypothetical protein
MFDLASWEGWLTNRLFESVPQNVSKVSGLLPKFAGFSGFISGLWVKTDNNILNKSD